MTAAGAEMFAVPSMDAIHWSERQHVQHAELFRHRALENGRWMAVCATSGVTQIIDPHGNRRATIPLMKDGVLVSEIFPRREMTFYTRLGWRFPQGVAGAWLVGTLLLPVAWLRTRNKA
jgi:apolipoprotein N-acyltransferase